VADDRRHRRRRRRSLKLLEENHYDLILMDIEMPVLNGYETIGKIRGEKKLATPVIALSASVSDLTVTSAISFGFDDFLVKPFKPGELLSKLARWFNVEHITGQHTGGTNRPNGKKADPSSGAASGPDGMKIIPAVKPAPGLNGHAVETLQPRYSDTARLAHALGGDPALVRKMIASFLEITPAYYRDLMTAFALHKPQTVSKLAHKLKSSVALLGVRKTVDNLEEIQAASRDPLRHHELNSLLDFFKTWYPQLCGELQESL
jgi:CheY-like chemotaxis protein/HPt (histidine-containing phosphotransfer) domain-containing protein